MSLPTRNQINKQIKFIVILSLIFISLNYGPSTFARWGIYNSVVVANNISNVANDVVKSNTSEITQNQREGDKGISDSRESLQAYPETKAERHDWILDYLSWEHPELKNEEINNLLLILEKENGNFEPNRISKNNVYHCRRANNSYYSSTVGCGSGDERTRTESDGKSLAQVLDSSWTNYKCEGVRLDPKSELDCMAKIFKKSGYSAWYTSSKKLKII